MYKQNQVKNSPDFDTIQFQLSYIHLTNANLFRRNLFVLVLFVVVLCLSPF